MKHEVNLMRSIFRLLKGVNIHPAYLLVPISLSLCAAAFEGMSVGLLIPLLNGFLQKDFSFIKETPMIGPIATQMLPVSILNSDRLLFAFLLVLFVVGTLLKNVFKYLSAVSMAFFGSRSLHHLRKTIFGRYLLFGKLYFDRTTVGHHNMVLNRFAEISLKPVTSLNKYLNTFFSLCVYFGVMISISWKLTLFALPLFLVLHLAVRSMVDRLRSLSFSIAERSNVLGKQVIEILSTMSLVKASATEDFERKHFSDISDENAKLDFKSHTVQELMLPLQEIITLIAAALLFSGMLYLSVVEGTLFAPSLIVYFYLVINAASKFGTLTGYRSVLANAAGAVSEVEAVLDDNEKFFVRGGKQSFTGLSKEIELRNLSFSYSPDRTVLRDVSFRVPKGSMTALVGPTGAGKTSIISLLLRYYDCPPGSVLVDGKDLRSFSIPSFLSRVALVSQETQLLNETLRYNITYGLPEVSDKDLEQAVRRARLDEFIAQLPAGLDTRIGDRGVQLSGGEKQRVSLARAFLKNADILILDEATSSLDSRTERLIREAIDDAVEGRTSIVIAHRLSTIQHADQIIVIEDGRCTEQGTLQQLQDLKGKFHELWQEQKFD